MVTIRGATTQDYPAVRDLTYAAYIEAGHIRPDSEYADALCDIPARAEGLYVAETQGRIAGSVNIALPGSPMAQVAYDNELEFRMLAVHPDFQRQGIGGVAITTMSSMTAAQTMYQAIGFHRAPHRDWSLETAGTTDDAQRRQTFPVYVHPLDSTSPSEGDSWLTK